MNIGGLETRRAHQRHERIGLFIEMLLRKHGKMTARQLVTQYIDEKWPFGTMKPRVDANQVSKLIKQRPNIVAERKGNLLAYSLKELVCMIR
ncbi:MAG: hypothetical protein SA339_13565 [Methanomassiliicoccus sp.]|nr:hypothetical protein [Methanomassiliicoccus sp.]